MLYFRPEPCLICLDPIQECLEKVYLVKRPEEQRAVVATDLSNKDAYRAPEKSKAETNLTNNITEPVKTNKYLETMKVFEVEAQPKSDPTNELESPETWH